MLYIICFQFQEPQVDDIKQKNQKRKTMNSGVHSFRSCNSQNIRVDDHDNQTNIYKHRSADNYLFPSNHNNNNLSPPLSRNSSKRSTTPINVNPTSLLRTRSRKSVDTSRPSHPASMDDHHQKSSLDSTTSSQPLFGKITSSRQSSINNPIMFSNSSGMLKPPPIEKKLECTLEELCYGCQKKIKITRDVVKNTGFVSKETSFILFTFCLNKYDYDYDMI